MVDNIYKKDEVIWQSEDPGDELKEKTKINLVVSLGPEETEAPETEAETEAQKGTRLPYSPCFPDKMF